jgi:hypothetical protein
MKTWPFKDPQETLDYGFDWSEFDLDDDVIVTTAYEVLSGDVEVVSHEIGPVKRPDDTMVPTGQGTITWLRGGLLNSQSVISLHAVTALGRELESDVKIKIKER